MKRVLIRILVLCILLSGCTLAQGDNREGETPVTDQLIGMLITVDCKIGGEPDPYEDLPVWNAESSGMADPLHYASNQGKRLYATLVPEEYEVDGEVFTTMTYQFPEGTGIPFMNFLVLGNEEHEPYWSFSDSPEINDVNRHLLVKDDRSHLELSGIIYVDREATDLAFHMNPVYQTPEGEVYALGTFPVGLHAVSMSGCPQTFSQEQETAIGEVETSSGTITLEIQALDLPERYVILEMDSENNVISSSSYTPEEMPREYIPDGDAAYLILESHCDGHITRSVHSPDDETPRIENYRPGNWGILIRGFTSIVWEGSE